MTTFDSPYWMWAEACELLDRAERLQRQFFRPVHFAQAKRVAWEPPVDIFETDFELWMIVALPGVAVDQVELLIDGEGITVAGVRSLPGAVRAAGIRRLEIPAGRFERRIELPRGQFELIERSLADGCLTVGLRKLAGGRSLP